MKKTMMCALTGHRTLPPDFDREKLKALLHRLIENGCDGFLCGMAAGFDLLALECLAEEKQKGVPLYLEACIPYKGQEKRFFPADRERYERLLAVCDKRTFLFPSYRSGCFLARDRYMVDCADVVLAYLTKKSGGTAYTVNYAAKKGVAVIYV